MKTAGDEGNQGMEKGIYRRKKVAELLQNYVRKVVKRKK